MAIMRMSEIKESDDETLMKKLAELRRELNRERGMVSAGGRASNPGRIKELRRTIARILTVLKQRGACVTSAKSARPPSPKKEKEPKMKEGVSAPVEG